MIRLGQIVKIDKNPFMVVSPNYEKIVKDLSKFNFSSQQDKLLACLVISQTEKDYKKYLLHILYNFEKPPIDKLITDWQNNNFEIKEKGIEKIIDDKYFNDGLNNAFYINRKKGTYLIRQEIIKYNINKLNNFKQIILYFITAQMLHNWESSCIHLGFMILNKWNLKDIKTWYTKTWPIYGNTSHRI